MGRKLTDTDKIIRDRKKQRKQEQAMIERDHRDVQRLDIPTPAYIFEVGDEVDYGAWSFTEVLEVCEDGKYYKLYSCSFKENTNKGSVWSDKVHYEAWFRLGLHRNIEEIDSMERITEADDIHINYQQRDLSSLISKMSDEYGIDLNPEYQRGLVWTYLQKIALIDSIFKNVDIGKFAIIKREWGSNPNTPQTPKLSEMLDGKQRLTAIWEFYCGRFKYKDKYFYELHPRDRHHFKHYAISYAETSPLTDEQKYRYFLKLNTTGVPIAEEHMDRVRKLWLDSKLKS